MKKPTTLLFALINILIFTACSKDKALLLGETSTGERILFVPDSLNGWGLQITGESIVPMEQRQPVQLQLFSEVDSITDLQLAYSSVEKEGGGLMAKAKVSYQDKTIFDVEDKWHLKNDALYVDRKVIVKSTLDSTGFYSAIKLVTQNKISWADTDCLAPGLLYGDPTYGGSNTPGGTLNYEAKRFSIREDLMSAPLFGLSIKDKNWVAVMDGNPDGGTTFEESNTPADRTVIDGNIKFGALGAKELGTGAIELGFWMPGTTDEFSVGFGGGTSNPIVRRRYNPVSEGFEQNYQVVFRFGKGETLLDMERDVWRWAWSNLNPEINYVDLNLVKQTLIDHLADRVLVVDDMAGIPFLFDAVTGKPGSYRGRDRRPTVQNATIPVRRGRNDLEPADAIRLANWAGKYNIDLDTEANELLLWPKIAMGFVSKGIETADQLLLESVLDTTSRGDNMRVLGLQIINSFVKRVPMSPPSGEGFSLYTGQPDCGSAGEGVVTLRAPSEGMRTLMDVYGREKAQGVDHPDWLAWCVGFADWLFLQQNEDGSFPRSWHAGLGTVREASGTSSYNPVPLLVKLSQETKDTKYINAAIKASEYVWEHYGSKGIFIGGATDNPNIVDKEAGMLSLEAYLILFEETKDSKWLDRAKAAANYAETWIWIWNVPMPIGADDATLNWKRGVPTVGVQGITARAVGGVDQYMAWSAPAYVKLYKYTNDAHYLEVAKILLHNTKAMLALPNRTYDLLGPGWQQEHWQMGPRRGYGGHRSWLPWVSVNHLHGITGIEQFDKAIFNILK
ncbi:hypothetical protein KO566_02810 [Flavobacteriaceae bacterium XHP0103]|uniref:hypothetical protein n=1 Tax=Marixanthotalea marina TaxID=2844359 RepID=UPI002989B16F|nr:hypothetical protein [Marixanthotalea marina]MBU3820978.1 hypothetical protein [Marixanthotalea marina]